jgi:hypothetical protein
MKRLLSYSFLAFLLCACNDTLDVQQMYSFELQTMPIPKRIAQGETVEIRCELLKEGNYSGAKFSIRYFQPDGKGELRLDDGSKLKPNDLYQLKKDIFRLYYTSQCTDGQTIDVYIEDSFGQVVQKRFTFSDNTPKEDSGDKTSDKEK